jgi:hypothetical protein
MGGWAPSEPDSFPGLLLDDVDALAVIIVPHHIDEIAAPLAGIAEAADDLAEVALRLGDGRVIDRVRPRQDVDAVVLIMVDRA